MPSKDTGLGWYADDNWLSDTTGNIGSIVQTLFVNQPVPVWTGVTAPPADYIREHGIPLGFYHGHDSNYGICNQENVYLYVNHNGRYRVFTNNNTVIRTWTTSGNDDSTVNEGVISLSKSPGDRTGYHGEWSAGVSIIQRNSIIPLIEDATAELLVNNLSLSNFFPMQPVPVHSGGGNPSASEIVSGGVYGGYYHNRPSNFVMTDRPGVYLTWPSSGTPVAVCKTSGDFTMWTTSGDQDQDVNVRTGTLTASYNDCYSSYWESGVVVQYNINALIAYNRISAREACELLAYSEIPGTSVSFSKSTDGYSVVCMCKWITEYGGDVYCSPVLISTVQNNTIFSRNNSSVSVPPTEHIFDGLVFYMRKAPLDILNFDSDVSSDYPIVDLSGIAQTNDMIFNAIALQSHLGVGEPSVDPYAPGGESESGRGDGTFDFSSTEIPYSGLPTIGAFATGMIDVYVPSRTELVSLSQYLWAGAFDVDNFKKIVADPMDVIIGLQIVPLTAAQIGTASSVLVVGNISTGLSMDKATKQYVEINMGTVEILPKWGAYLDFSPYSKLTLFLPYIGYVDINPDDCMNGTISVKYYVDIISGNCVAQVKCNDHVLYQFSGNCSCQLPITAGQYQNIALAGINILGSALGAASSMIMPKGGGNTGDKLGAVSGVANLFGTIANEAISMVKPAVQRSGGFGSSSGLMGLQIPYLILTVPRMCIPGEQNKYIGYPSFVTKAMNTLSGFNSVEVTHLNNMSCTAEEVDEIIALLSRGVIF